MNNKEISADEDLLVITEDYLMQELVVNEIENLNQLYELDNIIDYPLNANLTDYLYSLPSEKLLGLYTRLIVKITQKLVKHRLDSQAEEAN